MSRSSPNNVWKSGKKSERADDLVDLIEKFCSEQNTCDCIAILYRNLKDMESNEVA